MRALFKLNETKYERNKEPGVVRGDLTGDVFSFYVMREE